MLPLSLLSTATGQAMLIELKNGDTYNGKLVGADTWMNVNLEDVICTSRDGDRFWKLPQCYIRGNSIKYLRIPDEIIDMVAEEEESLNGRDKHERTPLHLASWAGHADVVGELLKEEGIEVRATAKDETSALHFACMRGNAEVASLLLAKGAKVNGATKKGATPLTMAAQKGEPSLVDLLLKRGADPLARTKKGETALDLAKTEVYDAIKEASAKSKEGKRRHQASPKSAAPVADAPAAGGATRKKEPGDEEAAKKKPKKPRITLSHLEDDE